MSTVEYSQEISHLNSLPDALAYEEFLRCCGSTVWASTMASKCRPFASFSSLVETAHNLWWSLREDDWLEAFSAHPKIGDAKTLKEKFSKSNSWEGGEQSGADSATAEVLNNLAIFNEEYHQKNGFIFLICATGKSADEMLSALMHRVKNDKETEIQIAAEEQNKITKLRLVKLLSSLSPTSKL